MEENQMERPQGAEQKLKKKMLWVLLGILGVMLLLLCLVLLLQSLLQWGGEGEDDGYIHFYPTYAGDIFSYGPYLELNRSVSYCADAAGYGVTLSITEANRADFDVYVLYLCDWIKLMTYGAVEDYNACFSESYLREHGAQAAFSPQMIYNACIYFVSEEQDGDGLLRTYRLDYMIHRNDGTLRRDVESDAIRPQYVQLRVGADRSIQIDALYVLKNVTKTN